MTPELRSAFNEVYTIFAPYKDTLDCARNSGVNRPLRTLTREDWSTMNREFDMPVLLAGDSTRFCHFLPRILEWIHEADDPNFEFGHWGWWWWEVEHNLALCGWLDWPHHEVEALRRVFGLWTSESLINQNKNSPLALLLDVAGDLAPFFNPWLEARPFDVAQWITRQDWLDSKPAALQWVISPWVEERLEKAFWENLDGDYAAILSRSIQLVESLRSTGI